MKDLLILSGISLNLIATGLLIIGFSMNRFNH